MRFQPFVSAMTTLPMPLKIGGALGALICGAMLSLTTYFLLDAKNDARAAADRDARNILSTVEKDIRRTIEMFDLSLQGVTKALSDPDARQLKGFARQLALFDNAARGSFFSSIVVLNEHGKIVEDSASVTPRAGVFEDRDFFFHHRNRASDELFLSQPFESRLTASRVLAISRRVSLDGGFDGVVVGTIRTEYFHHLLDALSIGSQGLIAIVKADGTVVERVSGPSVGASADRSTSIPPSSRWTASGQFEDRSQADGILRRFFVRQVGTQPLFVVIGLSSDDVFGPWRRKAFAIISVTIALLLGMLALAIISCREITLRRQSERRALASEARYRLLASNSSDGIVVRDAAGVRLYASPSYFRIIGRTPEELGNRRLMDLLDEDGRAAVETAFARLTAGEQNVIESFQCPRADGAVVWIEAVSSAILDEYGALKEVVTNVRDVTDRKLFEQSLEEAASVDRLTGLYNRRAFDERFAIEWRRAIREQCLLAVLMIDVDHFKLYNDAYGHLAGDVALQKVSAIISGQLHRAGDFVARFGGEEFIVVMQGTSRENALHVAELIRRSVATAEIPHRNGNVGVVTVSVGIATLTPQIDYRETLIVEAADSALYEAKALGRNQCVMALNSRPRSKAQAA